MSEILLTSNFDSKLEGYADISNFDVLSKAPMHFRIFPEIQVEFACSSLGNQLRRIMYNYVKQYLNIKNPRFQDTY